MSENKGWTNSPEHPAGKVQCNRFNQAVRNLASEHNTRREKWGIIGGEEHEHCMMALFGAGCREDVKAVQLEIGEKYGWTVTSKNVNQIIADITAALPALIAGRPCDDKRVTMEEDAQRKAEGLKLTQEREAREAVERAARQEAMKDTAGGLATVRRNLELNGVEVVFPAKPASDVIASLKSAGFRWSMRSKCWYKRFSDYAWQRACEIAGVPATDGSEKQEPCPDRFDMDTEDRMAEAVGA